jgi:GT2 family glycosyltransferase
MPEDRTIFDEPHYRSLERLAVQALATGHKDKAFAYADRRCRIRPPPGPQSYTLRAEALFQMGERTAAIADLDQALHQAPDDIAANRRMFAWADGERKSEAALNLVGRERDAKILREAIEVLRADGRQQLAQTIVYDDAVSGWAVWQGGAALEITISGDTGILTTLIEPDPSHAFAEFGRAANFDLRRPKSVAPQSITLSISGEVVHSTRAPPNDVRPRIRLSAKSVDHAAVEIRTVAVVVPVYADLESLRICLESLSSAVAGSDQHRIVLVNDATPDLSIAKYLDQFANRPSVLLLKNAHNLGFVGAVNRALKELDDEDVVLLNSDTIVPKDFAARLAETAASDSNIGTVTPLSNSGEETSFPVANKANPLGSADEVMAIDAIAAKVNAGRIVDIPNGTGFCLYITRECLDALGPLSEDFYRGYVEDIEYCLRARAKGFRNVCAASIYVGHAGSKSFGQEKRALVVRNFEVLDRRYPTYQTETAGLNAADPLAHARRAIERAMPASATRPRLLLTGAGVMTTLAALRARQINSEKSSEPSSAMILEVHVASTGPRAKIFDPAGGIPQSLTFDLSSESESDAMVEYVRAMHASAIEIIDPSHLPLTFVDRLLQLDVPHDIFIGDAALSSGGDIRPTAIPPSGPVSRTARLANDDVTETTAKRWHEIAATAGRILVPSEHAQAFALSHLDKSAVDRVAAVLSFEAKPKRRRRVRPISRLGLLPVRSNREEQGLIGGIAAALRLSNPVAAITVVGATLDDVALMRIGNVFVTGAIDPADFNGAVKSYGLQALYLAATRPIFGHPTTEVALACGLPIAFFDWSGGRLKPRNGDLVLDPATPFDEMMVHLGRWMAKS